MTLITKVSLQMTFLWDCTRASILCLHNCPAELLGSFHGSWWSLHSSEGKQLLPSENPAPAPQASLAAAQGGFVLPLCLTRVSMSSGHLLCCCDMGDPVTSQGQLCMVKQHSHLQVPVELLFTGWWLPWSKLEASDDEFPWEMGFSWDGCEDNDFFFFWWGYANEAQMTIKR